jgi:mono/diheme cytochrome c family protein
MTLAWMGWLGCTARLPPATSGIELEDPNEGAQVSAVVDPDLIASGTDPSAGSSEQSDSGFVYSREPLAERAREVAQHPIHINESWWPFRARHLGITVAQAQSRDAQLSQARVPAGFWDSQTSVEAVSVWTVLCNECHGGRRSVEDALGMPVPPPMWGTGEGVFFGRRRTYGHVLEIVYDGGPVRESGRAEMPAWRRILSTEMIWALLYFLEYQSGGIESHFAPSLQPRRPKVLGEP